MAVHGVGMPLHPTPDFDIVSFLADCREAATAASPAEAVAELVERAVARPDALAEAAAGVFVADDVLTAYTSEARPGSATAPHSHEVWAVLGCYAGREESVLYRRTQTGLVETEHRVLELGQVQVLTSDAVHAVFNRWSRPNGILHLYGGHFATTSKSVWDPVSGMRSSYTVREPLAP